ncbi:WecB/TagA/CpsF family glycosyltransferase [Pannonibacter indicus]|uniref:WecB/TagA/CpsF family glycosyltransferase n=1 Tax=Pannonibacter indicus TaxID=466044 RepID=UPI001AD9491B|nr:WecB/TagA/CpsF family glycosyltransferase [Pannonibacter indicus]
MRASRQQLTDAMLTDCKAAKSTMQGNRARLVFDANGHGIALASSDKNYKECIESADIIHADGGFIVTLSRFICKKRILERSATTDLFHDFAKACEENGLSFYLLGGTEDVNRLCSETLARMYPSLRIVGRRNGYFSEEEEPQVVDDINSTSPDVLWIGLGKPKEQAFALRWRNSLNARWAVTCGGCYNYITGHYPRAPKWMQRMNIEWLHRAASNPKHLLWRYLTTSPYALWIIAYYAVRKNRT